MAFVSVLGDTGGYEGNKEVTPNPELEHVIGKGVKGSFCPPPTELPLSGTRGTGSNLNATGLPAEMDAKTLSCQPPLGAYELVYSPF